MNKKELVRRAAQVLRDNGTRKAISSKKQVFHISDDYGNCKDFEIRQKDKGVLYTADDIEAIVDACIYVTVEALKKGESLGIRGIGTLGLKYRRPHSAKIPGTEEWVAIDGHYVPKFTFGDTLRRAADMYATLLQDAEFLREHPELEDDVGDEE